MVKIKDMVFEQGKMYRNDRMLDVDMYILSVKEVRPTHNKLQVLYYARRNHNLQIGDSDEVIVLSEFYPFWYKLDSTK